MDVCGSVLFLFFSAREQTNDGIQKYHTKPSTLHTVCDIFLILASVGVQEPLLKPLAFTDKTLHEALTMAMDGQPYEV